MLSGLLAALLAAAALYGLSWAAPLPRRRRAAKTPPAPPTTAFPPGFLFGVATSDHQIEHAQDDDWTAWEQAARAGGRGAHVAPGRPLPGHVHGVDRVAPEVLRRKTDWDERFASDLDLLAGMGANAHRLSFSWARLFPRADMDAPDPVGVAFYDRVVDAHLQRGIEPVVTLHHFANPAWLARGVENEDAPARFAVFARAVAERFGDRVKTWCTINEPMVVVALGYMDGVFPPGERRRDPRALASVVVALLRMHAAAYRALHDVASARGRPCAVGLAHHFRVFEPLRDWAPVDRIAAWGVQRAFLWDFLDALRDGVYRPLLVPAVDLPDVKGTQDYLGVNYYGRFYVRTDVLGRLGFEIVPHDPRVDVDVSDVGWASDPEGFRLLLQDLRARYGLPVHVMENGIADADDDDARRRRFLVAHVDEMLRAIEAGVDVRGYFHWSFLDNFEWAEGFDPRFGLVKVDYERGFARSRRTGASVFERIARARRVDDALREEVR